MHALELPELLTLIAQQLKKSDLAACCRVKKSWFVPFAEQLWRHIAYKDFKHDTNGLVQALPRYAIYVYEISFNNRWCMDDLILTPQLSRLTSFRPSEVTDKNRTLIQDILRQNPLLVDLYIEFEIDIPEQKEAKTREMVKVMMGLKKLESLFFKNNWISARRLESLVWAFPRLKFFSFETIEFRRHIELELLETGRTPSDDDEEGWGGGELDVFQQRPPLLLQVISMRSPGGLFSAMAKIIQSSPSLTHLLWEGSEEHNDVFPADIQCLAQAIHKGCPKLDMLDITCQWMSSGDFFHLVSLWDPWEPWVDNLPLPWLPLTSISLYHPRMEAAEALDVIWLGRDVFQHTLEYLSVILSGYGRRRGGPLVINILETFQKLVLLAVPETIVDAKLFFHPVPYLQPLGSDSEEPIENGSVGNIGCDGNHDIDGEDEDDDTDSESANSHPSREIKVWACDSLRFLEIEIQGVGPYWCPPELLNKQISKSCVANVNGYPLFDPLKAYLDGLPQLNQKDIQYSARSPSTGSVSPPTDSEPEY